MVSNLVYVTQIDRNLYVIYNPAIPLFCTGSYHAGEHSKNGQISFIVCRLDSEKNNFVHSQRMMVAR
jgi:hypothetical protein